jgi:nicotinate-nucleotide adenylyltransferase
MTEIALRKDERMTVSRVELEREGPSYTIDTIEVLRDEYPDDRLFLMIGGDELVQFKEWRNWESILRQSELIGINRPGTDENRAADRDVMDNAQFVEIPEIEISSTLVRKRLRSGQPVDYFLPESVREYIREHQLYRS